MKKLKNLFAQAAQNKTVKSVGLVGTGLMASSASHAEDITETITAISTTANTNQSAVIAAVISLAAISFGVGFILRWLIK